LLFIGGILVFASNRQEEVRHFFLAKLAPVVKKLPNSDRLQQNAINYEHQVDAIAK
jgi:hypothetical protein